MCMYYKNYNLIFLLIYFHHTWIINSAFMTINIFKGIKCNHLIKIYTNEEKGIVKTNSTLNKIIRGGVVVRI